MKIFIHNNLRQNNHTSTPMIDDLDGELITLTKLDQWPIIGGQKQYRILKFFLSVMYLHINSKFIKKNNLPRVLRNILEGLHGKIL